MKIIIACAGNGTRLKPITSNIAKPLVKILGKSILEYNLESIKEVSKDIIVLVSELNEIQIKQELSKEAFKEFHFTFIVQKEISGTASALLAAKDYIEKESNFLLLYGDDIHSKANIVKAAKIHPSIIGKKVKNFKNFGILQKENDKLVKIIEKPKNFVGDTANIGIYHLTPNIFEYYKDIHRSIRGEYELTDLINVYAKDNSVTCLDTDEIWLPLGYPWDILTITTELFYSLNEKIEGIVEQNVTVKGKLILGKGSIIKAGTYIEGNLYVGDNCTIGPNAYIRGDVVCDNNSIIGQGCEVKSSNIGKNTKIRHLSYVGDSIIMNNVNIGAGVIIANLRNDKKNVKTIINDNLLDTGRIKFGAVIGDNVNIAVNSSIMPGIKISPNKNVLPNSLINRDIV